MQGFCCLMQLSTREADYLVDVLALRPHVGPVLAPVFADTQVPHHCWCFRIIIIAVGNPPSVFCWPG